jgi:RND family efflux transporter MFP subunit
MKLRSLNAAVLATLCAAASAQTPPASPEFDCLIEPMQTVEIRSPVAGLLQQVHTRRGATVSKGQVLVSIESSVERSAADAAAFRAQAQGTLQSARNRLNAAREKSRRMTELAAEEFVSAQARDDAAAELKLAESELRAAEESTTLAQLEHRQTLDTLTRRTLRSPFDGVVVDQYLYPGSLVDGGEGRKPILKIAQTHPLAVQAILPYKLYPQLAVGQAAVVLPEAPFGGEIPARVRTVDRVIDPSAGTFGIVADIDNRAQKLPAGIRCKIRLVGVKR